MAEDRKELKEILSDEPFKLTTAGEGIPGPDKLRAHVAVTKLTDAWMTAHARVAEKVKVDGRRAKGRRRAAVDASG